jgi:hypothetical protein
MTLTAEKEYQHLGESKGSADHDFDLVKELTRRLEAMWRYDQCIANAGQKPEIQELWRELKRQDQKNIEQIKKLIGAEVQEGCF